MNKFDKIKYVVPISDTDGTHFECRAGFPVVLLVGDRKVAFVLQHHHDRGFEALVHLASGRILTTDVNRGPLENGMQIAQRALNNVLKRVPAKMTLKTIDQTPVLNPEYDYD